MSSITVIMRFLGVGALEIFKLVPICIIISFMLGLTVSVLQSFSPRWIRYLLNVYVLLMRGLPPLTLLLIVFFTFNLPNAWIAAVFALSIYHAAYIADIIRGSIKSLPRGQFEAADSLGLHAYDKILRVIFPQVWLSSLPALAGQYIILVKDTALVSAIGVMELLYNARLVMQIVYNPLLIYGFIAIFYFLVCFTIERSVDRIEKRVQKQYGLH